MSAQTGLPAVGEVSPQSSRLQRAATSVRRIRNDPNPIWMRELRQSARLTRTPIILATLTGMVALLICSIGGIASVNAEPASVGSALFQTFFSLAFGVVTWVGPAVAATTIASERGGRTWEALTLTGLGSSKIAQGKFLSAMTYISMYIVMLAPVGALPFLFGGVTATEVFAAFALLFFFAALSVAFGLSLSSKFSSAAAAITVTLLVTIVLSTAAYLLGGVALSFAMHDVWPAVPSLPVWLPSAYVLADFGLEYIVFLFVIPLALVALPAWMLYEVTIANMRSVSDDRSTGLRRWFLVAAPLLAFASVMPAAAVPSGQAPASIMGICFLSVFFTIMAFVFAGEPLGPSRRVQIHWGRRKVGRWRRYLGPGVLNACSLLLIMGLGSFAFAAAGGMFIHETFAPRPRSADTVRIAAFSIYAAAFFIFVVGFTAWSRARSRGATAPRLLLLGALFVAALGPWIIAAITGAVTSASMKDATVIASPSPLYAFHLLDVLGSSARRRDVAVVAAGLCSGAWALIGLGLLGAAKVRVKKVLREHVARIEEIDAVLLAEDEARAGVDHSATEAAADEAARAPAT